MACGVHKHTKVLQTISHYCTICIEFLISTAQISHIVTAFIPSGSGALSRKLSDPHVSLSVEWITDNASYLWTCEAKSKLPDKIPSILLWLSSIVSLRSLTKLRMASTFFIIFSIPIPQSVKTFSVLEIARLISEILLIKFETAPMFPAKIEPTARLQPSGTERTIKKKLNRLQIAHLLLMRQPLEPPRTLVFLPILSRR